MSSISPGVVVIIAAAGLLGVIFAIWAVCVHLIPHLNNSESRSPTLPQTVQQTDPNQRQSMLRSSLYRTSSSLLFQDPRNNISDYDLKESRYSTNVLELSQQSSIYSPSQTDSRQESPQRRSRPDSQSRSHSRSRSRPRPQSRSRSLADLRTSLYSEKGLLQASARSSTFNLVIDQPDVITDGIGSKPRRPKSAHLDSPTSAGRTRSSWSNVQHNKNPRSSTPLLANLLNEAFVKHGFPTSPTETSTPVSKDDSSPATSRPVSVRRSRTMNPTATTFAVSSRHSLPNLAGYFDLKAKESAVSTPDGAVTTPTTEREMAAAPATPTDKTSREARKAEKRRSASKGRPLSKVHVQPPLPQPKPPSQSQPQQQQQQ